MGVFFPPRRGSLLKDVSYVKTKMFEETWLFVNLLLTYLCVSNRDLLASCCLEAAGELKHSQFKHRLCLWGLEGFGASGLLGFLIWGLEMGSSGPLCFSVTRCSSLLGRET